MPIPTGILGKVGTNTNIKILNSLSIRILMRRIKFFLSFVWDLMFDAWDLGSLLKGLLRHYHASQ
jgi:hypothetical protein